MAGEPCRLGVVALGDSITNGGGNMALGVYPRSWRALLPDAVHPHAVGQLAIADRAARALGAPVLPSAQAEPDEGPRALARWAWAWGRMWLRDVARRLREGGVVALRS